MNDLIDNIDNLHTTKMGIDRIKRNLSIEVEDVIHWCTMRILDDSASIERKGKNWYVTTDDFIFTVNAYSYTVITAHKAKR